MSKMRLLIVVLLAASLMACASVPYAQHLQQRQQAYTAAAGAPVRSFRLVLNNIYSWEPLSDTQLVIYTLPTRAYLLDVWPCNYLTFTNTIGLTSFANQVQVGFDEVLVGGSHIPCAIKQIRPVDLTQFKMEKAAQHHIDSLQRNNATPAGKTGN
ncbi:DUF6491 family protein [Dyella flava]|uniref:Lipoprotein n=1 Tax=Dyella flava TaxID=1920170 RepID=A0ABS2K4A8_9GAMM|nr:DUF6491 family protein [Dyella flava]MBM7126052.1 hypothetical protein [Dyella flava]GLQ49145.1 hypothetical protein GCM10010872_05940 [Dyella flava]